MKLTLYRGITVMPAEAEKTREKILSTGLSVDDSKTWRFECINLSSKVDEFLIKEDLSTDDTRPSCWIKTENGGHRELLDTYPKWPAFCACGDKMGASNYAISHNRNVEDGETHPLLIEFSVNVGDIQIDGRDFLYTAFQMGSSDAQGECLQKIFGERILVYFNQAKNASEQGRRIALCDLAIQDSDVVLAHAKNEKIIGGRYRTIFCSAFFVKSPVMAESIISVTKPDFLSPVPDITLDSFRRLGEVNS